MTYFFNPFSTYSERVKKTFRFGQDDETREFIQQVLRIAETQRRSVPAGEKFWRAQLGPDRFESCCNDDGEWIYDRKRPHPPERMTPSAERVGNGRANPAGIAYWYVATDPETAIAEMRPWQGATLSIAELQSTRELHVIDCGNSRSMLTPHHPVNDQTREKYLWNSVGEAFSRPVEPSAIDVEYVPTQMIAEALRIKGYDGIQYKSHLGEGVNITLFDLSALTIGETNLWTAERVKYDLRSIGPEIQDH